MKTLLVILVGLTGALVAGTGGASSLSTEASVTLLDDIGETAGSSGLVMFTALSSIAVMLAGISGTVVFDTLAALACTTAAWIDCAAA